MTRRTLLPLLIFFLASAPLFAGVVSLDLIPPETIDDGGLVWRVVVTNGAATAFENTRLYFWEANGTQRLVTFPDTCERTYGEQVVCTESFAAGETREIRFVTEPTGGPTRFMGATEIFASNEHAFEAQTTVFGRTFTVTSVEDDGPGSLRQAILDINRECAKTGPCGITFNIAGSVPDSGWFAIQPKRGLPDFTAADVFIDGRSQTRYSADTNPHGPEVVLDGSMVSEGNGLTFRGSGDVRGIAIEGFPANGIEALGSNLVLDEVRVVANGGRGVELIGGFARVEKSILSGNRHAGGVFWTAEDVLVLRNVVSDNGASGLFFHNPAMRWRFADVRDNVIENNAHAGIALTPFAAGNFALNVMRGNHNGAIDVALDGPTPETTRGLPGQGGIMGPPIIESARYANGVTTITGHANTRAGGTYVASTLYFYANTTGRADADEVIGSVVRFGGNGTFTLTVDRDLRGKFITASEYTVWIYNWDDPAPGTSELSAAVEVR